MIFKHRATENCVGMMLGHGLKAGKVRFAKGHWLTQDDTDRLRAERIHTVFAGVKEPDDILENEAAAQLAKTLMGQNIRLEAAHTGRCNLISQRSGVLVYDRRSIIDLNSLDEKVTFASLPKYSVVGEGALLGTVKIIPFAIQTQLLKRALEKAIPAALSVRPFAGLSAAFIETELQGVKPLTQKNKAALHERLSRTAITLCGSHKAAHTAVGLATVLTDLHARAAAALVLIFGASATVDENDVVPSAIRMAGGEVLRVGMPTDPGNLLVHGRIGTQQIIGLPGCAKSPALNGFDWVLERLAADIDISPRDWAEMAVGGLLKEIKSRPQPRRARLQDGQGT